MLTSRIGDHFMREQSIQDELTQENPRFLKLSIYLENGSVHLS